MRKLIDLLIFAKQNHSAWIQGATEHGWRFVDNLQLGIDMQGIRCLNGDEVDMAYDLIDAENLTFIDL